MPVLQQFNPKPNTKSRLSSTQKSEVNKKSLSHKQKIVNAIKKSPLNIKKPSKPKSYSKPRQSNTEKKKKSEVYQSHSQRIRGNKIINSLSKSIPVKTSKQKLEQFPFEVIKFKQEIPNHIKHSQTHEGFCIRYDQGEISQINMSVLNNPKKINGSYNQRVGKYSQMKAKNKAESKIQVKNTEFKESLVKLFKFLNPHSNKFISHAEIDYKKIPQAVLYFLGGLFQKIREKNLCLSQKDFYQECTRIYFRSSNEDVKWFIGEIKLLALSPEIKENFSDNQTVCSDPVHQKNQEKLSQVQNNFQKQQKQNFQRIKQKNKNNNLSFGQQDFSLSFQNQISQNKNQAKINFPSDRQSIMSAQFGFDQSNRFSFNQNDRQKFENKLKKQIQSNPNALKNAGNFQNYSQKLKDNQFEASRTVGIRRNLIDKTDDIRQQIYAKLDKMKINSGNKENQLFKDRFNPIPSVSDTHENMDIFSKVKMSDSNTTRLKNPSLPNSRTQISSKQTTPLSKKPSNKTIQRCQNSQLSSSKQKLEEQLIKGSGWINKIKNCQKAFDELQKIKNQFKLHKNTIEQRQLERQNYLKNNFAQSNSSNFNIQTETRVLKYIQNKPQSKIQEKQSTKYQRNIDRLTNLGVSNFQNTPQINLNETLSNSCRKPIDVSLPLRSDMYKTMSFTDKKVIRGERGDKIDELASKLEKYLRSNAQKIEYSKNITQACTGTRFNRLLAA